jgi:hypothetical protein
MGSREQNFYNALAVRMGYGEAAAVVQDKYLVRDYDAAMAALPFDFLDRTSLLGPVDRIAAGLRAYADAGVTTLAVAAFPGGETDPVRTLRVVDEAYKLAGLA